MIKKMIKFGLMWTLILSIPILFLSVARWQDTQLLNAFTVESITENNPLNAESELTVANKLKLIARYNNNDKNIITISQMQDMNATNITKLKETIQVQLDALQALGIVLDLKLDDSYTCYKYVLRQYSEAISPKENVTFYEAAFFKEGSYFSVWQDADTHKIYHYSYYQAKQEYSSVDVAEVFGRQYLGLSDEEINAYFEQTVNTSFLE